MTSAITGVAEPDPGKQACPLTVKQSAVVGRQTDRRVTLVDRPAQIVDSRPVTRRRFRKYVGPVLSRTHVAAHLLTQAIIVVAAVPYRKQVAIFGIENKQEAVEQD